MKLKYILSVIAIVAITQNSFAQYAQDAIRFSGGQTGSTARIKAVGNAGTAVGGDLSSVSGNPAGLGFFTRSELSVTPEYLGGKTTGTYMGQSVVTKTNKGNLNNAAFVIYNQLSKPRGADKNKGWLSLNYGVAYNRTNDFSQNINYRGSNSSNSINDYYASQANSLGNNDGSLQGWAYDQELIDLYTTSPTTDEFRSNAFPGVNQEAVINRTGGQSALDFSIGGNYSNKLYLGLNLSFTDLNYNAFTDFYEDGSLSRIENGLPVTRAYSSTFSQTQATQGTGFGAKLGIIYKPVEAVRLGATFTSPTFYNIDDVYYEGLSSKIGNSAQVGSESDDYRLNYNLRTPYKVSGGIAVFIKQFGFITGDIDYIDYTSTRIGNNADYDNRDDNAAIKSLFQSAVNARIGAEARVNKNFLLRGGYGIQGAARKINEGDIKTASAGVGLRFGSYYVDATYAHVTGTQTIFPYEIGANSPGALLNRSNNNGYLTLGYRF